MSKLRIPTFLLVLLVLNSCSGLGNLDSQPKNTITVMTANLTSGIFMAYGDEGINILQAFDSDIVLIQEFVYGNGTLRELVDLAFGDQYVFYEGNGSRPNGIISKYPILSSGFWDDPSVSNRDLDWSIIDIPGDKDLFVVSVNLSANAAEQNDAAVIIDDEISAHKTSHPDGYYYLAGGSLNISSVTWAGGTTLSGNFDTSGPYPVDKHGDSDTNSSRSEPHDLLYLGTSLEQYEIAVTDYGATYQDGLVFDSRIYTQSELDLYFSPVEVNDSAASNMQHMAVVKRIEY